MEFFASAVGVLQTLVIALGAGLAIWGVILPIAGIILTFVMCYELIQIIIQKNNMHDIDTWVFFKWIFKTFIAVLLADGAQDGIYDLVEAT